MASCLDLRGNLIDSCRSDIATCLKHACLFVKQFHQFHLSLRDVPVLLLLAVPLCVALVKLFSLACGKVWQEVFPIAFAVETGDGEICASLESSHTKVV